MTPTQRHSGQAAAAIMEHREQVYSAAKSRNPRRWTKQTRNWKLQDEVWLNPERIQTDELKKAA